MKDKFSRPISVTKKSASEDLWLDCEVGFLREVGEETETNSDVKMLQAHD